MAHAADAAEPFQIDMHEIAHVGPFVAVHHGGSSSATRFRPARARTRVTVERGNWSAVLICQEATGLSYYRRSFQ
jgi:hypothetical protein